MSTAPELYDVVHAWESLVDGEIIPVTVTTQVWARNFDEARTKSSEAAACVMRGEAQPMTSVPVNMASNRTHMA